MGTTALRHPGDSVGYRVHWAGSSVYITDTEHPAEGIDSKLLRFVYGADVMIIIINSTMINAQAAGIFTRSYWRMRIGDWFIMIK